MNHAVLAVVCVCVIHLGALLSYGSATVYLPESHRVYDFLERMEHQFYLSGSHLGTRPLTRAEAARLLYIMKNKSHLLTRVDEEEFQCLLDEFKPDFQERHTMIWDDRGPIEKIPSFFKEYVYRNRRNLYSKQGEEYSLFIDPVIIRKTSVGKVRGSAKDDNVFTSTNGLCLRGTVGERVGFFIDVRDSKEWGSREYPENTSKTLPGRGFASFKGDRAEYDETYAHIAYSTGPFTFMYGRGETAWGRGRRGTFTLSSNASPYDMFRVETRFWKVKFSFFAAELKQYPPVAKFYYNYPLGTPTDSVVVKKYLSGNRLDIDVTNRLSLGFYETVIFGGRWEMSYLNPVMFLKGGEHYSGDHDNATMGMDFRLFVHRSHSIYGEFFIDDITTTKLGTDWYGNKLAYQVGSYLVEPFGFRDVDARIEYSRLNPWVYTHRYPINSYTHYGDVLGHVIGPNSDEMFVEIRKRFSRRLHSSLSYSRLRHGANPEGKNIGGDPLQGFRDGDSKRAEFLGGVLEKTSTVYIDASYEIFWQFFVRLGYSYEKFNGYGNSMYRFSLGLNE